MQPSLGKMIIKITKMKTPTTVSMITISKTVHSGLHPKTKILLKPASS
jgi:hypothetical protein